MNGGICHLSTETCTSSRGTLILKTASSAFHFPVSLVTCSMRFVSSCAATSALMNINARSAAKAFVFIVQLPEEIEELRRTGHVCQSRGNRTCAQRLSHDDGRGSGGTDSL